MMANMKKRMLSLALALVMALSLLPAAALAAGETLELGATYTTGDQEGTGLPTNIPENAHWVRTGEHRDTAAAPVCGLQEHTHGQECAYEAIDQADYDSADPDCFTGSHTVYRKNVLTCTEPEHIHGRDCYGEFAWYTNLDWDITAEDGLVSTFRGDQVMYKVFYWTDIFGFQHVDLNKTGWYYLTCTAEEHTHAAACYTPGEGTAEEYDFTEEATDYYRYTCGKTVHAHTEACYPMVYDWELKSKYTENSQKVLDTLTDGKASFGVYRLYENTVPENINQWFSPSLFGPSGNDVPYFTVTVDMARLLAKDGMDTYWNGDSWYVSLDSCKTLTADQFWANLEDCMSEADLAKFQDAFSGLFRAYVIKHEASNHMDGVMTVDPPTYTVELYDGTTLCHTNTLSKTPHTLDYVKGAYETYLAETYGAGVMDWTDKTYTVTQGTDDTADDVKYTVSIQAWPEESGAVKYTATTDSKEFNLAVFRLRVVPAGSLTIAKEFAGDLTAAPTGFDATFTVKQNGVDVESFTWAQVRDGEAVLEGLASGEVYTVTESVTGGASVSGTKAGKDGTFTHSDTGYSQEEVTIGNGNTTVTVTNTYTFVEAGKATVRYAWDTVNGVSWPAAAGSDPMEALGETAFYVKDGAPAIKTVPDITALGPGYTVSGWYLSQDADAEKAEQADLDALTDGDALTLYARLKEKTTGYQVRYDYWLSTNGGQAVHVAYGAYSDVFGKTEPKVTEVFNSTVSPVTYQGVSYAKKDTEEAAEKQAEVTFDGGTWADQDMKFTVKVYGSTYSEGALTIRKTVTGLAEKDAAALSKTLVFRVYNEDGQQVGSAIPYSAFTSGAYTLAEDLPLGTYTVKESGGDVAGYAWINRDTASETGYPVTVSGASASCAITNAYESKAYTIYFDAGEHGDIQKGGSEYTWHYFRQVLEEYGWLRASDVQGVGGNQVRFAVIRTDLYNGAGIDLPAVTPHEGYRFQDKWATKGEDPVLFANLADSLKAMDEAGETSITYYAVYDDNSENGNENGNGDGNGNGGETGGQPGSGNTTTELPEVDVPLTDLPQVPGETPVSPDGEPTAEIPEEEVPLAQAPETGDASALLALMTAVSGSGLAWLGVTGKKRKEEDAE